MEELDRNGPSSISKNAMKVEIIIPTLNEGKSVGNLIKKIRSLQLPINISILVIDGGSSDDTLAVCVKENVRFLIQKGTKGKGSAMREAVEATNAEIVVFMDGDDTYSPSELSMLLDPLIEGRADMVVGSRVRSKREKGSISFFNTLGNRIFNWAINFAIRSSVTDSLSGYRAIFRKVFKDLILFSDTFEIEIEMTVEALAKGYRVLEVPISYRGRRGSGTKLNPLQDGVRIARTLLFILMNVNPLKFFSIISLGFFVSGIYPAAFVLNEKITTGEIISMPSVVFSSLLFVTGTLSIVVGLLAELVVRSRRRVEYLINREHNSKFR